LFKREPHKKGIFIREILKPLKKAIKRIYEKCYYWGNAVYCPCCGKQFRLFQDYIYNKNTQNESHFINNYKNTICPFCRSKPRHRILCYFFDNHNILPACDKQVYTILMFGAEYSIKEWFKTHGFSYTTADLFDKSADIEVDIHKTPFSDESWHLIICNHVLQHVNDFMLALFELKRILKKWGGGGGGYALLIRCGR
jgi:hypothetical protein